MAVRTFPYCPACGSVRPDDISSATCLPCANQGHFSRLVSNDRDRAERLTSWKRFWKGMGFTQGEINATPIYRNLKA